MKIHEVRRYDRADLALISGSELAQTLMRRRMRLVIQHGRPFIVVYEEILRWLAAHTSHAYYVENDNTDVKSFIVSFEDDVEMALFRLTFEGWNESDIR